MKHIAHMGTQNAATLPQLTPVSPPPKKKGNAEKKPQKTGKLIKNLGKMGDSTVPIP